MSRDVAGAATVNSKFGTRTAVMLGDFFFAESSAMLAELANQEVRLLRAPASLSALQQSLSAARCCCTCRLVPRLGRAYPWRGMGSQGRGRF